MLIVWRFIQALFWINSVLCAICDVSDHNCTTKGANNSFVPFVSGIDNIVESSDPLRKDIIKGDLPTIKYQLTNASFSGMKDCFVTSLKIDKEKLTFQFNLECPHIVIRAQYKVNGTIAGFQVEGDGACSVIADDYVFVFNCVYEKSIGEDNKPYVQIKTYDLDVNAKGNVLFDFKNLFGGNKEKSDAVHKFLNENWKKTDKVLRLPTISSFMTLFVENLNTFLKAVPVDDVLQAN